MAITFQLVESSTLLLRYLATQNGQAGITGTIPNAGGASADLMTDIQNAMAAYSANGAGVVPNGLRPIIRAALDGFGPLLPGPLTQSQARAILNSDESGAPGILDHTLVARAVLEITRRSGTSIWTADVGVDGGGNPTVVVTTNGASSGEAYIDVRFCHTDKL